MDPVETKTSACTALQKGFQELEDERQAIEDGGAGWRFVLNAASQNGRRRDVFLREERKIRTLLQSEGPDREESCRNGLIILDYSRQVWSRYVHKHARSAEVGAGVVTSLGLALHGEFNFIQLERISVIRFSNLCI